MPRSRTALVLVMVGAFVALGAWALDSGSGSRRPGDDSTASEPGSSRPARAALETEPARISVAAPSQRVALDPDTPSATHVLGTEFGSAADTRLVRGVVFEGEDGAVAAGRLEVHVASQPPRPLATIELEPDGGFELRMLVGLRVTLRAELPHGPVGMRRLIAYRSELPLEVAVHAYPRGSIAGRLVDRTGRGLPGFRVEATQDAAARHPTEAREIRPTAVTDRTGAFELEDLRLAATDLAARGPRGSREVRWPLAEGLDPAGAPSADYTLPLVELSVVARGPWSDALALQPTESNWAPLGVSALSYRPVEGGWIGPGAGAEVRAGVEVRAGAEIRERSAVPPPGAPARLAVETGHTYELTLSGADHATLVQEVLVPDADEDVGATLLATASEAPVPVELVLEDARGVVGSELEWTLLALRNEMHHPVRLPAPASTWMQLELPPGRYSLGVRFLASESAKRDPAGRGASTSPELLDGWWTVGESIEVEDAGELPGLQRFLLETEHATPPLPPGLVGPGDY